MPALDDLKAAVEKIVADHAVTKTAAAELVSVKAERDQLEAELNALKDKLVAAVA